MSEAAAIVPRRGVRSWILLGLAAWLGWSGMALAQQPPGAAKADTGLAF